MGQRGGKSPLAPTIRKRSRRVQLLAGWGSEGAIYDSPRWRMTRLISAGTKKRLARRCSLGNAELIKKME